MLSRVVSKTKLTSNWLDGRAIPIAGEICYLLMTVSSILLD